MRITAGAAALILLAACSAPASRAPAEGGLRVAAFNLEHLAERDGEGCKPRRAGDYADVRRAVEALDADVVAFQEVQSPAAAARVFDPARYVVVMEGRPAEPVRPCGARHGDLKRQPMANGIAIRRGLAFTRGPDLKALGIGDPERPWGVDVTVTAPGGRPLRVLAAHLKAGCATNAADGDPRCVGLHAAQGPLKDWMRARLAAGERFVVAGDFNRELARPGDRFWAALTDNGALPLATAAGDRKAKCGRSRTAFIDHVLLGGTARDDQTGFEERTYGLFGKKPSDHCPVVAVLRK